MPDLKEVVLAELAQGTHTEAFADGARWAVQEAGKLAAEPAGVSDEAPIDVSDKLRDRLVQHWDNECQGVDWIAGTPEEYAAEAIRFLLPARDEVEAAVREALESLGIIAFPTSARNDADEPLDVECVVGQVAGYVRPVIGGFK